VTKYSLKKFADDRPDGYVGIQKNFNRLEKWTDRDLMKFIKGKSKVLCLGTDSPKHQ